MKISLHQLKQGNHAGYKIRWWRNGKRKEAYRKSYKDAVAIECNITEKVLFGGQKTFKKTHLSDSQFNGRGRCIWATLDAAAAGIIMLRLIDIHSVKEHGIGTTMIPNGS